MKAVRVAVLFGLMLACVLQAAPPASSRARFADEVFKKIKVRSDIVYGHATNSRGKRETLRLDLREPVGDRMARRPVFIWAHGGYLQYGDKAGKGERKQIDKVTRAGFVTLSINYRLRPELEDLMGPPVSVLRTDGYVNAARDAQHDAQAAVRWARRNANRYRLDPKRIAIGGHSAGGLIAAAVAFNSHDPGRSGNAGYSSTVAAAVSMSGGAFPQRQVQIDPREPPIQFIHAFDDDVLPYAWAALPPCLVTRALGNVCEQVVRPSGGHRIFGGEHVRHFLYRQMMTPQPDDVIGMTFAE